MNAWRSLRSLMPTTTPCMQQYVLDGKYYGVTPDGYVLERTVKPVAQADSEKK